MLRLTSRDTERKRVELAIQGGLARGMPMVAILVELGISRRTYFRHLREIRKAYRPGEEADDVDEPDDDET